MTYCALFTVLIAVGALINVPIPVCPFTLQFFFTTMAGIILGGKKGAISVALYTALGLLGLPVFAEGGGFWYVLFPSRSIRRSFLMCFVCVADQMCEEKCCGIHVTENRKEDTK